MEKLFVCDEIEPLMRAFTPEQRAESLVLTTQQLRDGGPRPSVKWLFSTWGMAQLTENEIGTLLPNLQAVFYGAGTVQYFARPFLKSGVRVFSAWAANAVPVAEFTLAQILLSNKGFFQLSRRYRRDGYEKAAAFGDHFDGNYGARVGLLGAGMIGKKVIELLRPFRVEIWVYDPFLSEEEAKRLGVCKVELEALFAGCQVVSNHLANNAQTRGMLNYHLFSQMGPYATFINTGRGAQVVVDDLVRAMREEPGRTALLDVTDPQEPLPADSPLWQCENILITPHRAGSQQKEVFRMGETVYTQYENLLAGRPVQYEVTEAMLRTMA